MTNMLGQTLTPQGERILVAVRQGLAAMTRERWAEIAAALKEDEENGVDDNTLEWGAPEFEAARKATEGIEWDFDGWRAVENSLEAGYARIGGVSMVLDVRP